MNKLKFSKKFLILASSIVFSANCFAGNRQSFVSDLNILQSIISRILHKL